MSAKYGKISREDFIEKLGRTEEEADILVRAQEAFPELTTGLTRQKGFVVDGETLCKHLEVKDNYNTWLLNKKGKNIGKLISYGHVENVDYTSDWELPNASLTRDEVSKMSPQKRSSLGIKNKITLTMECAKMIAIRQNNKKGNLICRYFLLMEAAIRDLLAWDRVRNPQRYGYNQLKISVTEWYNENKDSIGKPLGLVMAEECNMIYLAVTGYTCKGLKKELGLHSRDSLRDNLPTEVNSAICNMQDYDKYLIDSGYDFEKRRDALFAYCDKRLEHLRYDLKR